MIKYLLIFTFMIASAYGMQKQDSDNFVQDQEVVQSIITKIDKMKEGDDFKKNIMDVKLIEDNVNNIKSGSDYRKYQQWIYDNKTEIFAKQSKKIKEIDNIDLEKNNHDEIARMLQNYRFKAQDIKKNTMKYHPLMIFVSSSMPKKSLQDLIFQANEFGAVIVLRGFIGSLRNTSEFLEKISSQKISAIIDPRLFKIFQIKQVPTFVVLNQEMQEMGDIFITPSHDKIVGNITLEYALNHIIDNDGSSRSMAKKYLTKKNEK